MLFALTNARVHVDRGNGGVVVFKCPLHEAFCALVALVDSEVFGADVEDFLLALGEVETVRVDGLSIVAAADGWLLWGGLH